MLNARHRVENWASPRAFALGAREALAGLGYQLAPVGEGGADVRIVSEGQLGKLSEAPPLPMILLTGRGTRDEAVQGPHVVGTVHRPATLKELYRLLQLALEETPRAVPRVETTLAARWVHAERETPAAIVSISEKGCLLQCRDFPSDAAVELCFALPGHGLVRAVARPVHRDRRSVGVAFERIDEDARRAIASYVEIELAEAA